MRDVEKIVSTSVRRRYVEKVFEIIDNPIIGQKADGVIHGDKVTGKVPFGYQQIPGTREYVSKISILRLQ